MKKNANRPMSITVQNKVQVDEKRQHKSNKTKTDRRGSGKSTWTHWHMTLLPEHNASRY